MAICAVHLTSNIGKCGPRFLQVFLVEQGKNRRQFLWRQVPPLEPEQKLDEFIVKPLFQGPGGISPGHSVGGDVPGDNRAGGDDGPVTDGHPRQDHALPADPHVVAHHDIPLSGQLCHVGRGALGPEPAEDMEGIGGDAADAVVGGAHDKLGARGDGTEFADDQFVSKFRVIEQNIAPLKGGGIVRVIIVGVVPHENIGGGDDVFQET